MIRDFFVGISPRGDKEKGAAIVSRVLLKKWPKGIIF
jgi:hypothetical protein